MRRGFVARLVVASMGSVALLLAVVPGVIAEPTDRPAPAANALRVATWNVNSNGTCGNCRHDPHSWQVRRSALAQSVAAAAPDVIAVQEANLKQTSGVRHIDDLRAILGSLGYAIASEYYLNARHRDTSLGSHIFVRPSRVVLTAPPSGAPASGYTLLSRIAGSKLRGSADRSIAWAFLMGPTPTNPTLLFSVHLPTPKTTAAERARVAIARNLVKWANDLADAAGFPNANLVVAGDLNSFDRRQPSGAQTVLSSAGLTDGFVAADRINAQYGTINYTRSTRRFRGYPPAPPQYDGVPTRLDYVMATVQPQRYEVFLVLDGRGRFDPRYRASDHNMVMVDLPIARVAPLLAAGVSKAGSGPSIGGRLAGPSGTER